MTAGEWCTQEVLPGPGTHLVHLPFLHQPGYTLHRTVTNSDVQARSWTTLSSQARSWTTLSSQTRSVINSDVQARSVINSDVLARSRTPLVLLARSRTSLVLLARPWSRTGDSWPAPGPEQVVPDPLLVLSRHLFLPYSS